MRGECRHCGTANDAPREVVPETIWGRCGACGAPFFKWQPGEREAFIADTEADLLADEVIRELQAAGVLP